jgi:hypothetical protein
MCQSTSTKANQSERVLKRYSLNHVIYFRIGHLSIKCPFEKLLCAVPTVYAIRLLFSFLSNGTKHLFLFFFINKRKLKTLFFKYDISAYKHNSILLSAMLYTYFLFCESITVTYFFYTFTYLICLCFCILYKLSVIVNKLKLN